MKKLASLLALVSVLVFTGCSSKEEAIQVEDKVQNKQMQKEMENAPNWVYMKYPNNKNRIYAIGVAESGGDKDFQIVVANALAKNRLAKKVYSDVQTMVKTFKESTGKNAETYDKAMTSVSKEISKVKLTNIEMEDVWYSKSGSLYMLISIDKDNVKNQLKENIKSAFEKDKSLWEKEEASEAQKELNEVVERHL